MSDRDALCRAAALMRERAEAATPGPWVTGSVNPRTNGMTWFGNLDPEIPGPLGEAGGRDAQHIASWHPAVALAVANWLDETAVIASEPGGWVPGEALAVARAYLGE